MKLNIFGKKITLKLYIFDRTMRVHSWMRLPAMTRQERRIIEELFSFLYSDKPFNIFEYGSGFSTVFYAKLLEKMKIPYCFHTVDNSRKWYQKVTGDIKKGGLTETVKTHICEFDPFWEKEGWDWETPPACGRFAPSLKEEIDYINKPLDLNMKFDFIIVDGRFRRRCLEVALKALKEGGVVFLHDAHKEKYHHPLGHYRYASLVDSGKYFPFQPQKYVFWLGSQNNTKIFEIAKKYNK